MNLKQELNLQLFADAGTLVNASGTRIPARQMPSRKEAA